MAWQYHPLLFLFVLGGTMSLVVVRYCWRYVRENGWSYLVASVGLLGFNNAVWVFAATVKTASTDLETSLLFYKLEFVGLLPNTVVALVLAVAYVGKDRWLTVRRIALLATVPATFIALAVVNPEQAMIADPKLLPVQGILAFEHEFPRLFDGYLLWLYGTVLVAILVIAWGVVTDRVPTRPGLVCALTLLLPLATGALKTAGVYPPGGNGINVSPAAGAIGISVLAFAVVRYPMFELAPVGRDRAIEVMSDGYLLVGPDGRVLDANAAAGCLLLDEADATLKGRSVTDVLPVYADLTESTPVDLRTAERTVEVSRSNVTRQQQDAGEVLLVRDVSERRSRQRELERQNERLDEFASVVSHDLRNPLNVARGNLELERAGSDSDELAAVDHALERMESLIDDVLTLARQGQPISDLERVSLSAVATESWSVVESQGATMRVDDELAFLADRDRLQQLLENLYRNSVEHGSTDSTQFDGAVEDGGRKPAIRVGALPDGDGFYVADDGPGIPPAERERVFDSGYSTGDDGTGFGLAIVEEIADAHEWSVAVTESATGGARFDITGVDSIPSVGNEDA